ncbi:MAG: 3-oxoacyl-ACP reductase FabG [Cystobacterineae bacterium]|nr:3-oxoacyl-ACP reductase FabG [Cystobacterineae bacterium]
MNGRSVLVTGASRGIGRAIALAAAAADYKVIAHYCHSENAALSLQEEIKAQGKAVELLRFDIANRKETQSTLEEYSQREGALWGIVCNAGICADNAFPALTAEEWDKVLHTNLDGFYNVLHPLVMPLCRKKQGRIISLASVSGIAGNRGQVNYSASKAGIIGATKALALELASRSITVNCIAPGLIDTEMVKEAPLEKLLPSIPMGRIGKSQEVAALVLFLLSDAASYITRQVIAVDGGLL